jgi:hypothetical protein
MTQLSWRILHDIVVINELLFSLQNKLFQEFDADTKQIYQKGRRMNRRTFLGAFAAAAVLHSSRPMWGQSQAIDSLEIGELTSNSVPADFIGLSYESAQLANPDFFSPKNRQLVTIFRELAPHGNLRLGGGSSEYTTYSDTAPTGPPPFEVFGPDTSKTVKHGTITSRIALRNLRDFLDAVDWNCIYGLNLGQGTIENAVRESAAAQQILGPRLLAFQIGNEPDSFRNRYRAASYGPEDYLAEWTRFHDAIVKTTPAACFAGPDISNKLPYLTVFAEQAPKFPDVVLLTSHYYAMGPSGSPQATLENLLSAEPKLTTLKSRDLPILERAQTIAHLPYRMSEGNSCWDGGKPDVSDTFASALWAAGYTLTCMERGWAGVNFHGGGNGFYTPIAGSPSTGLICRPEFFGIRFAQRFAGAKFLNSTLLGADPRVQCFVFDRQGRRELALVNKTGEPVMCSLPDRVEASEIVRLHAPAINAKDDVVLSSIHGSSEKDITVAAYTATIYRLSSSQ